MIAFIIVLIIALVIFILHKTFFLTVIVGRSMFPTFYPNDIVLAKRVRHKVFPSKPKDGNIYFFNKPMNEKRLIVKRLNSHSDNLGICWFLGDNSDESCDSRNFGFVDWKEVKYEYVKTLIKSRN